MGCRDKPGNDRIDKFAGLNHLVRTKGHFYPFLGEGNLLERLR